MRGAERDALMATMRREAKLLADWPEDMIVTALRTSGKDLRAIRDGLDRAIAKEEMFGSPDP